MAIITAHIALAVLEKNRLNATAILLVAKGSLFLRAAGGTIGNRLRLLDLSWFFGRTQRSHADGARTQHVDTDGDQQQEVRKAFI